MSFYSPFDKNIDQIETSDLSALRTVKEGWFIEYKRDVPAGLAAIAKSISSFSNTRGGWLFYGIQEKSKEEPVAGSFPGVARGDLDAKLQRIRQAAASSVMPAPYYEQKLLWGPNTELELADDHCIIVIFAPMSSNTPHIHAAGVIYRRVGDASEPIAENDRFFLDQLWSRRTELRKTNEEYLSKDPPFSERQRETPFIRLVMMPDPWRHHDIRLNLSLKEARQMLAEKAGPGSTIPFDRVHTRSGGFIARQAAGNDPHDHSLTWKFWPDAVSDVLIPLNSFETKNADDMKRQLVGYQCAGRFVDAMKRQDHLRFRVTDMNYVLSALVGAINLQERLQSKANWAGSTFAKIHILNALRFSPFVDVESVVDDFEQFGVPVCLENKIEILPGGDPDSFFEIPKHEDMTPPERRVFTRAWRLFHEIALAFGIPSWIENPNNKEGSYLGQIFDAALRATEHQRLRSERKQQLMPPNYPG